MNFDNQQKSENSMYILSVICGIVVLVVGVTTYFNIFPIIFGGLLLSYGLLGITVLALDIRDTKKEGKP